MYNIAICEDEKLQANKLIDMLNKYEKNENTKFNIDYFESGELLISEGYEKYHIILMDVQMNELSGIETAKLIRETNKNVKIIFITSMEKYWAEGYKVSAYRYLLKPIIEELFHSEL
ncbi:MAG: LytR/AlgR family response regulator transcription factor, partial [Clostridium sp.]